MKRIVSWTAFLIVAGLLVAYAAWPRPLEVEAVACLRGTIDAFVSEEAETRLDDEYVITMPVNGRLMRIAQKEGTLVEKGDLIAHVDTFEREEQLNRLDARVREVQALIIGVDKAKPKPEDVRAAELAVQEAKLRHEAAKKSLDAARINYEQEAKQYNRKKTLLAEGAIPQSDFDEAQRQYLVLKSQYAGATSSEGAVGKLLEQTRVQLKRLRDSIDDNEFQRSVLLEQIQQIEAERAILRDDLAKSDIHAPVSGPILEKYQEDEQVLPAGTPLLKVGDLTSICIESDILSEEVGSMRVGQDVEVFGPAIGDEPISGKVTRIYPSGFEKISSLGIEQQRVKAIVAFGNADLQLRPGVRLDIKIITDTRSDALIIPERALFKKSDQWNVFVVRDGRADLAPVEVGLRTNEHAEVAKGLQAGDLVIPSPPQQLEDGDKVKVAARNE